MVEGDLAGSDGHVARQPRLRRQQVVEAVVQPAIRHPVPDGQELAPRVVQERELRIRQARAALGQGVDLAEARRDALRAQPEGLGQAASSVGGGSRGQHLGGLSREVAELLQAARPVEVRPARRCVSPSNGSVPTASHGAISVRSARKARTCRSKAFAHQAASGCRCRSSDSASRVAAAPSSLSQAARAERESAGSSRSRSTDVQGLARADLLGQNAQRVAQPLQRPRRQHRARGKLQQAAAQHPHVPDQVAAVDGGDVEGPQGLAGVGVVPVEEVPPVALQLLHRFDRAGGAVEQLPAAQVPQIVRGQVGQQRQAHVRRAGAMGHAVAGLLLEVVGGQPVLLRSGEHLEVAPGEPGDAAQEAHVAVAEPRRAGPQRPADPPRHQRRQEPQQQDRARRRAGALARPCVISSAATAAARAGPTHIRRSTCPMPAAAALSTAAAVCHSSRRCRL